MKLYKRNITASNKNAGAEENSIVLKPVFQTAIQKELANENGKSFSVIFVVQGGK